MRRMNNDEFQVLVRLLKFTVSKVHWIVQGQNMLTKPLSRQMSHFFPLTPFLPHWAHRCSTSTIKPLFKSPLLSHSLQLLFPLLIQDSSVLTFGLTSCLIVPLGKASIFCPRPRVLPQWFLFSVCLHGCLASCCYDIAVCVSLSSYLC